MTKKPIMKGIVKDIIIIAIGVIILWISIQAVFGTQNPFYVVASKSMVPELLVYDVLVVQGHDPFDEVEIGDIIVFNRPSDHDRVIVHRVVSITNDDPRTLRTQGDANSASIPGTDYPITEDEYIGTVVYVVPQIGYVTQILKPPINYIIIAIVIGIMITKQLFKKQTHSKSTGRKSTDSEEFDGLPNIDKTEMNSYSKHAKRHTQNEGTEGTNGTKGTEGTNGTKGTEGTK